MASTEPPTWDGDPSGDLAVVKQALLLLARERGYGADEASRLLALAAERDGRPVADLARDLVEPER